MRSNKQNCDNFCGLKFAGKSIFNFVYYASIDAQPCVQPRAVRVCNDNGRRF